MGGRGYAWREWDVREGGRGRDRERERAVGQEKGDITESLFPFAK